MYLLITLKSGKEFKCDFDKRDNLIDIMSQIDNGKKFVMTPKFVVNIDSIASIEIIGSENVGNLI